MTKFHVVPGAAVIEALAGNPRKVLKTVRDTYLLHYQKKTVNPVSCFLRFPDDSGNRVIALPAYVGGAIDQIGIKWIASFPRNLSNDLRRASGVLVLNDPSTGYPIGCLEAARISAARTAASAALAATTLSSRDSRQRLAFVGTGVIARTILEYLDVVAFPAAEIVCYDLDEARARKFKDHAIAVTDIPARQVSLLEQAMSCETVVLATTAATPYIKSDTSLRRDHLILNISLRDLAPEILLDADNVVDDVDHCLNADTSPHLAEQLSGHRDFISGTLGGALAGDALPRRGRPIIFSPFGLGILDVGVGWWVLTEALRRGTAIPIPKFFD
jgi:2,3-diaminopropionate biosynthesis protein SbnB